MDQSMDQDPDFADNLDQQSAPEIADQIFMHELLQHRFDEESRHAQNSRTQDNILSALDQIRNQQQASPKQAAHRPSLFSSRILAVAAGILAVIIPLAILIAPKQLTAEAFFAEVLKNVQESADRCYGLDIKTRFFDLSGDLTVRGSDKFVLSLNAPLGHQLTIGSNGQQAWLAPSLPYAPVCVFEENKQLQNLVDYAQLQLAYLQLPEFLQVIGDSYTIQKEDLTLAQGVKQVKIIAHLKIRSQFLPDYVELICDPEEHLLRDVTLTWKKKSKQWAYNNNRLKKVRFSYRGLSRRDDGFYNHQSHHDAQRAITYFPPQENKSREQLFKDKK